jgi:hypothetical protein
MGHLYAKLLNKDANGGRNYRMHGNASVFLQITRIFQVRDLAGAADMVPDLSNFPIFYFAQLVVIRIRGASALGYCIYTLHYVGH